MKYRRLFIVILMFPLVNNVQSQISIDTIINNYSLTVPQQKIHLHFDNQLYIPGQTIWYKAYLFSGTEPSDFSKNVYIDWYDDKGVYFTRTVSPVSNATAQASLTIPVGYTGKKLEAVAYTQWMLNFDSAFLCHRTLLVTQPKGKEKIANDIQRTTVTFFPEGGYLIEGLLSTLAFKATNQFGYPVEVNGIIKGRKGDQVAEFSSRHEGMGLLKFIPDAQENYIAEWKDPDSSVHVTQLPLAKQKGVLLNIGKGFADRPFIIERTDNVSEVLKKLHLVVITKGQQVFRANINLSDISIVHGNIPASQFPSGIAQVTLFDMNWQPVAERILFVNNEEFNLDAQLLFDTVSLTKRGKNVFELTVNDTMPATFSIAVTDENFNHLSNNTLLTNFLLTSDIKGYVHNPIQYFSSKEDSVAGHLDLVMLTNGWRRFKWQEVLGGQKAILKFPIDSTYISIQGKIEDVSKIVLTKAKTVNLILLSKDSSKQYLFLPLTEEGNFETKNLLLFDTIKVYYKLNNAPLYSKAKLLLQTSLLVADTNKIIVELDSRKTVPNLASKILPDSIKNMLAAFIKNATLQEVIVQTKIKTRIQEMDEQYSTGMFKGDDSYQFNIADNPDASQNVSVFHYLQSRVAGLIIKLPGIGAVSISWRGAPTIIFLDEFELTDPTTLFSIPMSDVAYIKVFKPPFFGGFLGGTGGAISVYTKKGTDMMKGLKGLNNTLIAGYTQIKEFYAPNYSLTNDPSITDIRRTLFWNSSIHTGVDRKKIRLVFYNNDITHQFRVILEGMNEEGKLIHINKLIK